MNIFKQALLIASALCLGSCTINDPIIFDNDFVHIVDESRATTSTINSQSNALLKTYYVTLVASSGEAVNVDYTITVGDGLTENVDFKLIQGDYNGKLSFANGVYERKLRIEWLRNNIDPTADNRVIIEITGCDNNNVSIGRPGPDSYGKTHIITKQ